MGLLSKFENKMEDGIEGAAGAIGRSSLSPVQITKKAEKQMRREKIVGAGKQYAPTLYTVLVSPEDDSKLFKYYPTLAGETETYLLAKAREMGYAMDGQPLVRFLSDPQLKKGKFEVVAEMVAASIIEQLRDDEMRRYGLPTNSGRRRSAAPQRERNLQPSMQPLPNLEPEFDEFSDAGAVGGMAGAVAGAVGGGAGAVAGASGFGAGAAAVAGAGAGGGMAGSMSAAGAGYGQQAVPGYADAMQPQAQQLYQQSQQPIQRNPMSADDMQVPSLLGSQVSEVAQASRMARGVSPDAGQAGRQRGGSVRPEQLLDDVKMVQQVEAVVDGAGAAAGQAGSRAGQAAPVVVVPALSQDVQGAGQGAGGAGQAAAAGASGGRGAGIDAVFGEGDSATVDIENQSYGQSQQPQPQVFLYDEARDRAYALTGDTQHIGRESANDIVVPDINISRVHAEIHMQPNGQWVISDLGSTNGLFINGHKVQSAPLRDADMITLGTSTLEFQLLA